MKNIKKLLVIALIILLSGCSGVYNIKINEDFSVDEEATIVLKNKDGLYDKAIDLMKEYGVSEKDYKLTQTDDELKVEYNAKYSNIEDYLLNSYLYKQLFNQVNYNKEKHTISFDTTTRLKLNSNNSENIVNDYNVSLLQINIETPYKVTKNNADEVYKDRYTWNLNSDTTNKEIQFTINKKGNSKDYVHYIVISLIVLIIIGFSIRLIIKYFRSQKM